MAVRMLAPELRLHVVGEAYCRLLVGELLKHALFRRH